MVTRCYLCGGATERRNVTAENWWGDELALVENVPAWVCQQCGEAYFDAETTKQLDLLRQAPPEATRTVTVPIYPFAAAA
jgi:YgiT-type zinc finger domain-containing protein